MTYERTVAAAVAETKSKFALAEALALDIPPRPMGPTPIGDKTLNDYLVEAQHRIIQAGGEERSIETLRNYRDTALWVLVPEDQDFRWIDGASFTAHRRAAQAGLSYEDFASLDKHTGDAAREAAGRTAIRSGPSLTHNLAPERKAEMARQLLNDPDVAEQIADDITDYVASDQKRTADVVSKRRQQEDQRQRATEHVEPAEWHERPQRDYDALVEQHVNGLSVALAAESSEKWTPSERSEALLYFLTQILGNRREPTGDQAEFVNDKLDSLFSEVEAYANAEVS